MVLVEEKSSNRRNEVKLGVRILNTLLMKYLVKMHVSDKKVNANAKLDFNRIWICKSILFQIKFCIGIS